MLLIFLIAEIAKYNQRKSSRSRSVQAPFPYKLPLGEDIPHLIQQWRKGEQTGVPPREQDENLNNEIIWDKHHDDDNPITGQVLLPQMVEVLI